MPNKYVNDYSKYDSSEMMNYLVEPKNELFGFNDLKMEPIFSDDIKFQSEDCDIDNDLMLQWSIDTCFGNGIELENNDFSPPSSPSSSGSAPSRDSQSSYESSTILLSFMPDKINTIVNDTITPKTLTANEHKSNVNLIGETLTSQHQTVSKNNFNASSMLMNQNIQPPKATKLSTSLMSHKIIVASDKFSRLVKSKKEKLNKPELNILSTPLVTSTTDINPRLSFPAVDIDLTKTRSHSPNTLNYNQLSAIKRHQRMIRNREAASLSRKKKKEYVASLEEKVNVLQKENLELKMENSALKDRLKILDKLSVMTDNSITKKVKKATIILSVFLMISFNITPLRIFNSKEMDYTDFSISQSENLKHPSIDNYNYHSRNILWVDYEDNNSSWNSTEQLMCPMYINISESIRIDHELRKWIDPNNLEILNDNLSRGLSPMSKYLNTNIYNINKSETVDVRNIKKRKSFFKTNLKKRRDILYKNNFDGMFSQLKLDAKESLFHSIERQEDTFYVVSFSGDHLLLPASHNVSNTTHQPKMSLVFPALTSTESNFVTMIQIDCAVTDTKTLQLRDTQLRHPHDLDNNVSQLKQTNNQRTIAHRPYFLRQSYSRMFTKINQGLPSY
ncbi:cyclic AMP-dependent transcription factor ATF-6 alpha isoform X2 [Daktulosphaira vitifoliae]|uniref:cyclic AMP-dependent transcription factor ATF-6 alpha isoform X2 n=1 Tax=Daktulosphaira vitifoliae TaxID=58002 RepID=UPI0021AA6FFD|nr:cyclic AMP-dependent transcription factor ATF-6 alpha isoform X2 [Daktulosphaira vitifoliae]